MLELAARRGLKGFSVIVGEAIERYLDQQTPRDERLRTALSVLGTIADKDADAMEASIGDMRARWR